MDTAQLAGAAETDPNVAIELGAEAFKAFTSDAPVRVRDDQGRFAAEAPDEETPEEAEQAEPETEDEQEAAFEAQPMPPSWPADQAEYWESLPPETQGYLAEREGERERAIQAKFQESANVRKAAEARLAEADANRSQYLNALEAVMSAIRPVKPDPRAFGAGTGQYDRESYDLALAQYDQQAELYAQLDEQRTTVQQEASIEAERQFEAFKQEHEAQYAPKLLADVPELTDTVKAEPLMRSLVGYAIANGVPDSVFAEDQQKFITSAQIHLLWKAQQFDNLRSAKAEPKPRQASPAVRPGVSSPRSAQKGAQRQKAFDRLARDGSVEAGAAVFKHYFK